jgi:serine/threonine-protein kinase
VESDLQSRGYKTQRANGVNDDDTVTGTNPPAGTRVPEGGTVTILTSNSSGNGQGTQRVPSVTGLTESQARNQLSSAGFTNIRVQRQQVGNASQNGRVIQQSPGGNQNADASTQVTILVGQFGNSDGLFGN